MGMMEKETGQEFVSTSIWFTFPPSQSSSEDFLKLLKKERGEMHRILSKNKTEQWGNSSCCRSLLVSNWIFQDWFSVSGLVSLHPHIYWPVSFDSVKLSLFFPFPCQLVYWDVWKFISCPCPPGASSSFSLPECPSGSAFSCLILILSWVSHLGIAEVTGNCLFLDSVPKQKVASIEKSICWIPALPCAAFSVCIYILSRPWAAL